MTSKNQSAAAFLARRVGALEKQIREGMERQQEMAEQIKTLEDHREFFIKAHEVNAAEHQIVLAKLDQIIAYVASKDDDSLSLWVEQ